MAIYSLDEILKKIIEWEKTLAHLYRKIEKIIKDDRSQKTVHVLKVNQEKVVHVLQKINLNEYKKTEFLKNAPDDHAITVITDGIFSEDDSPLEILEKILEYEEKLMEFYTHLRDIASYQKSKDILNSLVQSKMGQIKQIKGYMDSYDLVM